MARALLIPKHDTSTNVLRFPVVPRNTAYSQGHVSTQALGVRLLKDIIDTTDDGLLNQREADALARIDELLNLSAK